MQKRQAKAAALLPAWCRSHSLSVFSKASKQSLHQHAIGLLLPCSIKNHDSQIRMAPAGNAGGATKEDISYPLDAIAELQGLHLLHLPLELFHLPLHILTELPLCIRGDEMAL